MLKTNNLEIFTIEDNFQIQEPLSKKRITHANSLFCKKSSFLSCKSTKTSGYQQQVRGQFSTKANRACTYRRLQRILQMKQSMVWIDHWLRFTALLSAQMTLFS
uniref:Uncharacterized protein n=1 Tax=Brugia malayi TaxID=6279 RepID=A0A8L7SVZ1_BRUMA